MTDLEITNDTGEVFGWTKSKAFDSSIEKRTIYFWKSEYTWDELFEIADKIKEFEEIHTNSEEPVL